MNSSQRESRSSPPTGRADDFELRWLRQLRAFHVQAHTGKEPSKIVRAALRAGMDLLGGTEGCLAILTPGREELDFVFSTPKGASWDVALLKSFIRGGEDRIPVDLALGRLRRRGRMWGVMAVRKREGRFTWDHREALSGIAAAANDAMERIDQERIREVRTRIECKILEQLRPKDLFYQILHGLHSLILYNHSASLLIHEPGSPALEVVAETVTWKKGKGDKVGLTLSMPERLVELQRPGVVYGFDRPQNNWEEWTAGGAVSLAEFLDARFREVELEDTPMARSMLCAPLATRDGVLGLLMIQARHSGFFGPYEADLVSQLLPHASIALQNTQRTASLEMNLIQAERKHAMADLARGVAHDVNNALGAVLPLVQQIRADLESGNLDRATFGDDLRQIERSIQTSRRIFGGMLSFARGTVKDKAGANIKQAVDNTRAILKEGLERRGIEVTVNVEPGLPALPASQADLEQLFLNLLTNARDAMPQGGRLLIAAHRTDSTIQISVQDTGSGIPPENLAKVMEPFFSTKPQGNGLGLSICRSIVWQFQGKLEIISPPDHKGTQVHVTIPVSPRADI